MAGHADCVDRPPSGRRITRLLQRSGARGGRTDAADWRHALVRIFRRYSKNKATRAADGIWEYSPGIDEGRDTDAMSSGRSRERGYHQCADFRQNALPGVAFVHSMSSVTLWNACHHARHRTHLNRPGDPKPPTRARRNRRLALCSIVATAHRKFSVRQFR